MDQSTAGVIPQRVTEKWVIRTMGWVQRLTPLALLQVVVEHHRFGASAKKSARVGAHAKQVRVVRVGC